MISEIFTALKAGEELKDPAKWKNRQVVINQVGAVVAGVVAFLKWKYPDVIIPEELKDMVIQTVGGGLVVVNYYLTVATTKKIGSK